MLKRIYVDNYKCLVNFELSLGYLNLFLGPNGSGKSSVFEVLNKLRNVAAHDQRFSSEFKSANLTRWQALNIQNFELEIQHEGAIYRYELGLKYENDQEPHLEHERLWCDQKPLLRFENSQVQLYKEDFSEGPLYPSYIDRSALSAVPFGYNKFITQFKRGLRNLITLQIDPQYMDSASMSEEPYPSMLLANYSSWYRYLSRDQAFVFELTNLLRGVIPDFDVFKFESVSENVYFLKVTFRSKEGGTPISYSLRELSDGQRALIALYTLLLSSKNQHNTICLDEPENFLALPEIQPWLIQLYDQCIESNSQAILISHHPEMIDYLLASPVGYWFERPNNLAVRVKSISADGQDGLPVSELIARGWLHG